MKSRKATHSHHGETTRLNNAGEKHFKHKLQVKKKKENKKLRKYPGEANRQGNNGSEETKETQGERGRWWQRGRAFPSFSCSASFLLHGNRWPYHYCKDS